MKWFGRIALMLTGMLTLYVGAFLAVFVVEAPLDGATWPTPRRWVVFHLDATGWLWMSDGWTPLVWLWRQTKG